MEAQSASLVDLLDVRIGLECNSASLAARRADEADITALTQSVEEMQHEIENGRLGTEADTAFHMAIAYAAKNPLQILSV
ncbi:MAG: FCD domain-containing protein [Thermodesulfobacteriota bacterium]|nr:FCD domain-containing protein [Thermodesulfobacteriota bacterium]